MHAPVAETFLQAGFHVLCDKPLCLTLEEGLKLRDVVHQTGRVFVLTHNYPVYLWLLNRLQREGRLSCPHYTVVTDALTINSLWYRAESSSRHSPACSATPDPPPPAR